MQINSFRERSLTTTNPPTSIMTESTSQMQPQMQIQTAALHTAERTTSSGISNHWQAGLTAVEKAHSITHHCSYTVGDVE